MVFSFLKREPEALPSNPTVLLAEAQEFLKEENFEGALSKFDELCALPVQSPLPLLSRATCRLHLKKYEGVVEDCEKVLKFLNSDVDGHAEEGCTTVHSLALMRMAKAYKELGRLDDSKSALMRRNALEHKLGRDKIDTGDGEEADEDPEEAARKERQTAEEWKEKGNIEYKKENWTAALDHYKNGLVYDMYNAKIHSNACMSLIKLKRWSQALKHAEQCIALEPKWVKGYYMKGMILSNESKIEQACDVLRQATKMEPQNLQIKSLLDEVEQRVDYVESRLRRRKTKNGGDAGDSSAPEKDGEKRSADDSGAENNKAANKEVNEEDVDSDEEYCNDGSCRTPKKVKLQITRKDVTGTLIELCAAAVGITIVWLIVSRGE
ncbi:hypothetical protein IW140_005207 [Coemansia sp. RSA 1813]|nr:hypothetical protein EV178_002423 [Coemansia sp. RSA 1646]KAJ1768696.1 hypothetical protein LPJ74_004659 [Coemansia sp. RSA 1843]KAJ2093621.1 hypothetical protein IW138_000015 [Coemansia sp. RSA 986]KAJ2214994.1 hypothetical protein EV179_002524 [Coemansia sp. RSA 487]KAJ2565743.1 hypothetical protein IW140_005207 [Coemansia sp. RSA 1813]